MPIPSPNQEENQEENQKASRKESDLYIYAEHDDDTEDESEHKGPVLTIRYNSGIMCYGDNTVEMRDKQCAVAAYFAAHRGKHVPQDPFAKALWPGCSEFREVSDTC